MDQEHIPAIAQLNDTFRRTTHTIRVTSGVQALPDMLGLIAAVRQFNSFTPDNDPYGEHDFSVIYWHHEKIYWKIDYYDQRLRCYESPLSPDCRRILTILLASEY